MNIFYTSERGTWRSWLAEHFETENEIWFVFPMKESGDKSLSYNDAVEEALCFGWIDSTIKHIDPTHRAQRFTLRKKGSPYSRPNIERLIWLDERGMLHPSIRDRVLPLIRAPYIFPDDILDAIKATPRRNPRCFFMDFSDISTYQFPSRFRPKYTNLHQSYTNLAKLHLSLLKSHI